MLWFKDDQSLFNFFNPDSLSSPIYVKMVPYFVDRVKLTLKTQTMLEFPYSKAGFLIQTEGKSSLIVVHNLK